MNLTIMNFDDIVRYYKPETGAEHYLTDALKDAVTELDKIKDLLSDYGFSYHDARMLDYDLRENEKVIEVLNGKIQELKNKIEVLEDERIELLDNMERE